MQLTHMFCRIYVARAELELVSNRQVSGHWRSFRLALEELSLGLVAASEGEPSWFHQAIIYR